MTVDVLARLQLGARRCGLRIALRGAPRELLELVALMGLVEVLPEEQEVSGQTGGEMGV